MAKKKKNDENEIGKKKKECLFNLLGRIEKKKK